MASGSGNHGEGNDLMGPMPQRKVYLRELVWTGVLVKVREDFDGLMDRQTDEVLFREPLEFPIKEQIVRQLGTLIWMEVRGL